MEGAPVSLPYDYLVLATGVQHSYFGHDEYAPFAPGLKTIADADHLRNKILGAFEDCERTLEPSRKAEQRFRDELHHVLLRHTVG
jgi:NADH:ubiquinone reductase (H+-translocating)